MTVTRDKCREAGCDRWAAVRGLCRRCYMAAREEGRIPLREYQKSEKTPEGIALRAKLAELESVRESDPEKWRESIDTWFGLMIKRKGIGEKKGRAPNTFKCTICKEALPWHEFSPDRRRWNGLAGKCRQCEWNRLQQNLMRADNERRNNDKPGDDHEWCYMCRKWLRRQDFWDGNSRYNGKSSRCKSCDAKAQSARYRSQKIDRKRWQHKN